MGSDYIPHHQLCMLDGFFDLQEISANDTLEATIFVFKKESDIQLSFCF
jgi:hypothetical protein